MYYHFPPCGETADLVLALGGLITELPNDAKGNHAYIETNTVAPGVTIRGLTHYSSATLNRLTADADAIYLRFAAIPQAAPLQIVPTCASCGRALGEPSSLPEFTPE